MLNQYCVNISQIVEMLRTTIVIPNTPFEVVVRQS